eukprot:570342-Pleurochrysis_carterae.AAC.1
MPKRVRKEEIPSGRDRGPEKRMRARLDDAAGGDFDVPPGRLLGVTVSVAGERSSSVGRGQPREEAFVKIHVGSDDDAVRSGHPDVVGAGGPHAAPEVHADPSSRIHA